MGAHEPRSDVLIAGYLRELRVSAWNRQMSRARAVTLEDEVRANIYSALAAAGNSDEATVYRVLDRLGPPGAIVAGVAAEPRSGLQRVTGSILAPVERLRTAFRMGGWGLAEIGALALLIVGPFFVWWLGPIFGIILVRAAAERWSDRAMHRATVAVVSLFLLQVLISLALSALVLMSGGSAADQLQRVLAIVTPGAVAGLPLLPPANVPGGAVVLSPIEILMASPAYLAGLGSGLYLALSPRQRT